MIDEITFYTFTITVVLVEKFIVVDVFVNVACSEAITRDIVFKVTNVFTVSIPAKLLSPKLAIDFFILKIFKFLLAKHNWFHSCFIQTIRFRKVKDIELDFCRSVCFEYNLEEEPLGVSLCVKVVLQPEVVLHIVQFRCFH